MDDERIRFGPKSTDDPVKSRLRALADELDGSSPLDPFVRPVDRFELEMRVEAAQRILSGATDSYSVCIEDVPNGTPEHITDALVAAAIAVAKGTVPRSWMYSIRLDLGHNEVRVEIEP